MRLAGSNEKFDFVKTNKLYESVFPVLRKSHFVFNPFYVQDKNSYLNFAQKQEVVFKIKKTRMGSDRYPYKDPIYHI